MSYDATGYHDYSWRILTGNVVRDICGDEALWCFGQIFESLTNGRHGYRDDSWGRHLVTLDELCFRSCCAEHKRDYAACLG